MDLLESTLSTLLGELVGGTGGGTLGLLGLSGGLVSLLGLLVLVQLDVSGGLSVSGLLSSSLLDQFKGSTNNSSLVLDGLSASLLGGLLRDTLLVVSSVQDGPRESSGVLSLLEERSGLGRLESEDLRVTSDKEGTSAGVDLGAGEGINFNLHFCKCELASPYRSGLTL